MLRRLVSFERSPRQLGIAIVTCFAINALALGVMALMYQPSKGGKGKPGKKKAVILKKGDAKSRKDSPAKKLTGKAAVAEWKTLNDQRRKIGKELEALRTEFRIASRKRKEEIKVVFEKQIAIWNDDLRPKMVELSLTQLENDPDSELAGRLARELTDHKKVAAVTNRLIKDGKETGPVLQLAGITQFNINHFKTAQDLLEKARDKNALDSSLHLLLDTTKDYVKYWEREEKLQKQADNAKPAEKLPRVKFETNKGDIIVELFENEAPNTVANFISLVEKKHYDGQRFYDQQPLSGARPSSFAKAPMILAGDADTKKDFDAKKNYGTIIPPYTIKCECFDDDARLHFRGSLSMQTTGRDDGYSDFAIMTKPFPGRNPQPGRFGGNTVFGRVVQGMDVVDQLTRGDTIKQATVSSKRDHKYKPKTSLEKEEPKKKAKEKAKPKDGKTTPAKKAKDGKTTPKKKADDKPKPPRKKDGKS